MIFNTNLNPFSPMIKHEICFASIGDNFLNKNRFKQFILILLVICFPFITSEAKEREVEVTLKTNLKTPVKTELIVPDTTEISTEKGWMEIPRPDEASRISAIARILNPNRPLRMGCIRPAHTWKAEVEKGFIDSDSIKIVIVVRRG
jgi:uncharacterized radical SAM superfamily protein